MQIVRAVRTGGDLLGTGLGHDRATHSQPQGGSDRRKHAVVGTLQNFAGLVRAVGGSASTRSAIFFRVLSIS